MFLLYKIPELSEKQKINDVEWNEKISSAGNASDNDILERKSKGSSGRKGSFYTKNENNLFYHKLDAEYFFIHFLKTAVFSQKNCEKLF